MSPPAPLRLSPKPLFCRNPSYQAVSGGPRQSLIRTRSLVRIQDRPLGCASAGKRFTERLEAVVAPALSGAKLLGKQRNTQRIDTAVKLVCALGVFPCSPGFASLSTEGGC